MKKIIGDLVKSEVKKHAISMEEKAMIGDDPKVSNNEFVFDSEQTLDEISKIISDRMFEVFIKSGEKQDVRTANK